MGRYIKRSMVWMHFKSIEDGGKCNHCNKNIPAKGGNTSNLMKHLLQHQINLRRDRCQVFTPLSNRKVTEPAEPAEPAGPHAGSSKSNTPPLPTLPSDFAQSKY